MIFFYIGWAIWTIFGFRGIFRLWYRDFAPLSSGDLIIGIIIASVAGCIVGPFPLFGRMLGKVSRRKHGNVSDTIGRLLAGRTRTK